MPNFSANRLDIYSSLDYTLSDNPHLTNKDIEMKTDDQKLTELLKRDIPRNLDMILLGPTKEDDLDIYLESRLEKF